MKLLIKNNLTNMIKYLFLILLVSICISCSKTQVKEDNTNEQIEVQVITDQIDSVDDSGNVAQPNDFPQSISEANGGGF
jgi:hypothetical protein